MRFTSFRVISTMAIAGILFPSVALASSAFGSSSANRTVYARSGLSIKDKQLIEDTLRDLTPIFFKDKNWTLPKYILQDTDGDSLPDDMERFMGMDPYLADTDLDGYPDNIELENEYDPTRGNGARLPHEMVNDGIAWVSMTIQDVVNKKDMKPVFYPLIDRIKDQDYDMVPDELEKKLGTAVDRADTDLDGYGDGWELSAKGNPLHGIASMSEEQEQILEEYLDSLEKTVQDIYMEILPELWKVVYKQEIPESRPLPDQF